MVAPLFAGYAAVFGVAYEIGNKDVVAPGAFAGLLSKGAQPAMLLDHDEGEVIGAWLQLSEDETGLLAVGRIETSLRAGRRAYEMVESGEITGLSAKFFGLGRRILRTRARLVVQVTALPEISLVRRPANPRALLLSYTAGSA